MNVYVVYVCTDPYMARWIGFPAIPQNVAPLEEFPGRDWTEAEISARPQPSVGVGPCSGAPTRDGASVAPMVLPGCKEVSRCPTRGTGLES